MRISALALAMFLAPAVLAETVNTFERGNLGQIDAARTGVPRASTHGANGRSRWADGAETFAHGFAARRGANGSESFAAGNVYEDDIGQVHVRLAQSIAGLPVVGTDLIVHAEARSGKVVAVNGRFAVDRGLQRRPLVGASAAIEFAAGEYGIAIERLDAAPELTYIVDDDDNVRLAWTNLVVYEREGGEEIDRIFADARTGAAIARHPQVRHVKYREIYNCQNTTAPPWPLLFSEGGSSMDATANAAYNNAGIAYDYFWVKHGRDSMNGAGGTIKQGVHFATNYNNAGWYNNYQMIVYGDGNGTKFSPFPFSLDVVAHEFGHGVTHYAANLIYSGETGSVDEGFADVFGAATEAYSDGFVNAAVWKIADEVYTPATAGDALRYLNDPALQQGNADYYPTRAFSSDLHLNAGLSGLAFYLLSQGGQHPRGTTGFFVSAQGISAAERIFYRALVAYGTSTMNFRQLRDATLQAAADLYGVNSAQQTAMWNAWSAVGNQWTLGSSTISTVGGWWANAANTSFSPGYHTGHYSGPGNFNLYLEKSINSVWTVVASLNNGAANRELIYNGTAGNYRWRVTSTTGTGSFALHMNRPK